MRSDNFEKLKRRVGNQEQPQPWLGSLTWVCDRPFACSNRASTPEGLLARIEESGIGI